MSIHSSPLISRMFPKVIAIIPGNVLLSRIAKQTITLKRKVAGASTSNKCQAITRPAPRYLFRFPTISSKNHTALVIANSRNPKGGRTPQEGYRVISKIVNKLKSGTENALEIGTLTNSPIIPHRANYGKENVMEVGTDVVGSERDDTKEREKPTFVIEFVEHYHSTSRSD
ncbi:hypothetical protein QE152_g27047 [Popillia japonica]|uniref:Uncharacterized protein n=1 Tax=Popillia japonica TaxID=7064 RepID=A0AAW1JVM3_POPJA